MKRSIATPTKAAAFDVVRQIGLTFPGVEAATKYDGSPVLKIGGVFLAGLASHRSAEPDSLVLRYDVDEREWLIADAPDTYYLTDYYRQYPLILVRLSRVDREALRDLLGISLRLSSEKIKNSRVRRTWRQAPG